MVDCRAAWPSVLQRHFEREYRGLRRFVYGYLHNWEDAEDVATDAFLKAATVWDRVDGEGLTFLYQIAARLALSHRRRRRVHSELSADIPCAPFAEGLLDRMEAVAAWSALSPSDQQVLAYVAAGVGSKTAAEKLGVSVNAVKIRVGRARSRARACAGVG